MIFLYLLQAFNFKSEIPDYYVQGGVMDSGLE